MLVHLLALLFSLFSPFFQQANCLPYNLPDDAENPVFYYDASKVSPSDTVIQSCISHAISRINNGTCVNLMRSIGQQNVSIHFAFDSICGFDSSKSTIFLNRKCASDVDTCLQLVGRALTGKRKQTGAVLSHINGHFDCADHCSLECENGGKLVHGNYGSCSCQCPFNGLFTGETCSELVKLGEYTDNSCGTINATGDGGIIKLNGPLDGSTYCQFLLRSSDPWSKFQIQFIALNMSSKFVGSTECPDKLQVYGLDTSEALSPNFNLLAENSPSPAYNVKCAPGNAPKPGQLFSSIGNFLLFQLEGFRFDQSPRDGPIIRYTIRRPIFSDELHSSSAGSSASQQGQGIADDSIWTGRTEDGGPIGFLANHLSLVALLVVMFGVSAIVIVLLAIRRHSGNKVKRNSSGHTPVPTSPTPNASV